MKRSFSLATLLELSAGAALGATLMYYLDPQLGRRRRSLVRDQIRHYASTGSDRVTKRSADIAHRLQGMLAEAFGHLKHEEIDDDILTARIRSQIGHVTTHTHGLEVNVTDGRVSLRGHILSDEVDDILKCVRKVRGVVAIDNQLQVHATAGHEPSLQNNTKHTDLH